MLISEIFDSIDGEGIRAGKLCTFIRVFGCNLRCSYCDSMYAVDAKHSDIPPREMSVNEILSYVNRNYKRVTLTGGEPLLFPESVRLVNRLCEMGEGCGHCPACYLRTRGYKQYMERKKCTK